MWKTFIRLRKHKNDDLWICGSCISLSTCFIEADIISGKSLIYDMNFGFKSLYLIVSKNKIGFKFQIGVNIFVSNAIKGIPTQFYGWDCCINSNWHTMYPVYNYFFCFRYSNALEYLKCILDIDKCNLLGFKCEY